MQKYRSFSVNLFDTWRILFFGLVLLSLLFSLVFQEAMMAVVVASVIVLLIISIQLFLSYSVVTYVRGSIKIQNFENVAHLQSFESFKCWWCYDFGGSSIELGESTQGKSRVLTNKINYYVRFEGKGESIFIYEQIYLSDKFPNGCEYLSHEKVDESKMVKVWDVDKCLAKLNIQ